MPTPAQNLSLAKSVKDAQKAYQEAKTSSTPAQTLSAAAVLANAVASFFGLRPPFTGDPVPLINAADKLSTPDGVSKVMNNADILNDPLVRQELGLPPIPSKNGSGGGGGSIDPKAKTGNDAAKSALQPRRDPLTFDLDGDGIETTGIAATNPVMFDHDGDGVKNATGWVSSDDALLVLDKNGNGTIDNGRELFGDSTIKSNGQTATDGFDALADLDTNADGKISSADTQFNNLRLWRDLNQDGISQTGELFTLTALGISSISVTSSAHSQTLPNGNQIADLGTYTKTDGTQATVGAVTGNLADVNLVQDTFHRSFIDVLDTTSVATLPDMQGSGKVRDLREAATQSTTLQNLLTQFSTATTRVQQTTLVDQLLDAWADTGGMAEGLTQRVAGMTGYTKADGSVIPYTLQYNALGTLTNSNGTNYTPEFAAKIAEWEQKLHIIETFNGSYFYGLPNTTQTAGAITGLTIATPTAGSTNVPITVSMLQTQLDLLQQSYDAIKSSVYQALLLQTRFKPLLDQINLVIDANGINLDFTQLTTSFNQQITTDAEAGLLELIDFNFSTQNMLKDTGWQGWQRMAGQLEITQTQAVADALKLNAAMVKGSQGFLASGTISDDVIIGDGLVDNLSGGVGNDILIGLAGNDTLYGNAGVDTLVGGAGDDNLYASASTGYNVNGTEVTADDLTGGTGNDNLVGTVGANTYRYNLGDGTDTIDAAGLTGVAGAAVDKLILGAGITPANVSFGRTGNNLIIKFTTAGDQITMTNWYTYVSDQLISITFSDGSVSSFLTTTGTSGVDFMMGTTGADTMVGGLGNDLYVVDAAGDVATEAVGAGTDTVFANVTHTLGANVENLTLTGITAINGTGNSDNNIIIGNDGNNLIDGLAGNDTMKGGLGNDTYVVDIAGDVIFENANEGTDTVKAAFTYTLATTLENLTLTGTAAINGTGNALDNILIGNSAANSLTGGDGNDTLDGSTGIDTLIGGLGNDTYVVDVATDIVTEAASAGTDTVQSSATTYTLATNVENLMLMGSGAINGTGNTQNNLIIGNSSANILDGGTGIDTLTGGAGNDTYVVDTTTDVINELLNEGIDTVQSTVTFTLASLANVENLILAGTTAINGTGNALDNIITGNSAVNVMTGGAGNDTYVVAATNDTITELANEGSDMVQSSVTFSLAAIANLENLTLTGTSIINGTGNALDNILTGNGVANTLTGGDGNDTLNGLAGNDTMVGGLGNDIYVVDVATDVVTETAGAGTDTVKSAVTLTSLAANVENLTLTGSSAINGVGNALTNFLMGNAGNNTLSDTLGGNDILQGLAGIDAINDTTGNNLLDGGAGNDTMTGGAGRDIFIGGTGNDTITTGTGFDVINFNKGDGADIINASTGADNTLSLGGNFAYSDLSLTKTGNDLILKMGATDQLTLKDWYLSSPTNKSVINLQVVAEAIQGFSLGSADNLRNNKIENFNFTNLVAAFDTAGAIANWQLTDARLTTHLLAGSDTAAIGGDLAYQYGKNSNLTGMGSLNAQSVIAAASFGQTAQTLNNPTVWQAELVKLGQIDVQESIRSQTNDSRKLIELM